ncbi:GNAT family N-acetyltransferase [Saccharopolyspora spinosa]|nr:GNAT family N-acetyltransferase [Saccharopolyspora spinosa]
MPRQRQPETPSRLNDPANPRQHTTPQVPDAPRADAPHGPDAPHVAAPRVNHQQAAVRHPDAGRYRWAGVKHEDFAHVKGEGFRHWGPGWQQRVAEDARIRAESLGYHQPDRPRTPEPVPEAPPRSTPESMAAERPPENPFAHRWNNGVGEHKKLDISDELRTKLGGTGLGIRNSDSGLSMIRHSRQGYYGSADFAQRMPRPSVDPKRFTVEVHGSPDGVTFNGQHLSAKELAEIIKGAPGYKEGAPVRLLSCRTGADLPDGSPNFAQQLSKELGVEVLAPNKDAWVDNFGNMYASGSRAEFHPDASGTPQPRFDEPGEWVSFSPDGAKAVHESPFPPGHEPEWTRFGHQADAAHQRGFFSDLFGRKREDSFEFDPVTGENLEARRFDQAFPQPEQAPHPDSYQQPQAPQHQQPQQGWQQPAQSQGGQQHFQGGQQQTHLPQGWQQPQAPSPAAPRSDWSQPLGQQAPGHHPQPPQNQRPGYQPGHPQQPATAHQQPAPPAHQHPAQGQWGSPHQAAPQQPGRAHSQPHAGSAPHGAQQPHPADAPHRPQQPQAMPQQPGYRPASPTPPAQHFPGQHHQPTAAPQPPAGRQPPHQPTPPARQAGHPPVDVRGLRQNPPGPSRSAPPPDVTGPRMPTTSGQQPPTFGARTDGGFGPMGSQAVDDGFIPRSDGGFGPMGTRAVDEPASPRTPEAPEPTPTPLSRGRNRFFDDEPSYLEDPDYYDAVDADDDPFQARSRTAPETDSLKPSSSGAKEDLPFAGNGDERFGRQEVEHGADSPELDGQDPGGIDDHRRIYVDDSKPRLDELIPAEGDVIDEAAVLAGFREAMNGDYGGLTFEVTSVGPAHGSVSVRGDIKDASGKKVGYATRDYGHTSQGKLVVNHAMLHLDKDVRGQGFGREFSNRIEEWYKNSGVDSVTLRANSDVGGYTWARQGYEFANLDHPQQRVLPRLEREIRNTARDVEGMRAECAAMQPGDAKWALEKRISRLDLELREARNIADDIRSATDVRQLPKPIKIADLGRPPELHDQPSPDELWLGKRALLDPTGNFSWQGVKRFG